MRLSARAESSHLSGRHKELSFSPRAGNLIFLKEKMTSILEKIPKDFHSRYEEVIEPGHVLLLLH
jgi:hypothetical protein